MGAVFLGRLVDHRPLGGMGLQTCAALRRRFQSRLGSPGGFRIAVLRVAGSDTPVHGREVPGRSTLPAPPLRRVPATEPLRDSRETTTPFAANSSASCAWGSPSRRGRGRKGLEERLRSKCRPQVNDDSGWPLKWVAPDVRDPGWNDHRFAGVCNPGVLGLTRDGGRDRALRHLGRPVGVGAGLATRSWHPSRLIRVSARALGESCPTAAAASLKSAHPNFPRAPFAQRDAGRERGTDRECTQHRCEPDGVLVVENGVDTV